MERAADLLTALLLRATTLVQIVTPLEASSERQYGQHTTNDGQRC